MATTQTYSRKDFAVVSEVPEEQETNDRSSTSICSEYRQGRSYYRYALVRFATPPDIYKYREILDATINSGWSLTGGSGHGGWQVKEITEAFDPATVTYRTRPGFSGSSSVTVFSAVGSTPGSPNPYKYSDINRAIAAFKYGLAFVPDSPSTYHTTYVSTAPTITIVFSDSNAVLSARNIAPSNGATVSRTQPCTFAAYASHGANVIAKPSITAAAFLYKGDSETEWHRVVLTPAANGDLQYEFAGNQMPNEPFNYCFEATDELGTTATSPATHVYVKNEVFLSITPTDGSFIDRLQDNAFRYVPARGVTVNKFRYRKKGETTYTDTNVDAAAQRYLMPANTITEGAEYEYTFVATDMYGVGWQAGWTGFTTVDAISTAQAVSPVSTMVDKDNPVAFAWQHIVSTGSPQTKADLQKSTDSKTWETLTTVTGSETGTVIAAEKITSGTWWWRVRTYNLDNVAGTWSDAAQFVAIGSPPMPRLTVKDDGPRPVIEWQASEQEAYELTLDGEAITAYGTAKRWQSPRYLANGVHTISVRVQNSYGRWSQPGTASVDVVNTPGESIQLTAQAEGATVNLKWNSGGYDYYLVYRDDVAIARVTEAEYLDYFSCGLCTYRVRGCYTANNNYGISDPVTVEAYPRCPVIIDVETRAALWLELSDQQHRTYSMARARQATSYHIVGQARPSVDVSEFVDETLTVSAAFWADDRAGMRALEALLGRVVCLKTDSGEMATGVLASIAKTVDMFYTSYQLSVDNTEFEEEAEL